MSIYIRYFRITDGPIMEEAARIEKAQAAHHETMREFMNGIGAKAYYYTKSGRIAGFEFESMPDQNLWKKTRHGHWMPKLNSNAAKAMATRVGDINQRPVLGDVLHLVGLIEGVPVMINESVGMGYASSAFGSVKRGVMFVSTPWTDRYSPEEISKYRADKAAGIHRSMELDHMLWQPTEHMHEVKRWEVEKEIEEINAAIAAERDGVPAC